MKYILFSTIFAAQMWISSFEITLNTKAGYKFGDIPEYHYVNPVELATTSPYLSAVPIIPQVEQYLTPEEQAQLVTDISSYLPKIEPGEHP